MVMTLIHWLLHERKIYISGIIQRQWQTKSRQGAWMSRKNGQYSILFERVYHVLVHYARYY